MKRRLLFVATALLSGCAASPHVDYHLLSDQPRSDRWIPYELTDTSIAIGTLGNDKAPVDLRSQEIGCLPDGCADGQGKPASLAAIGAPESFAGEVLAIAPRQHRLVETRVSPTYFPDSLRPRTLDIDVRDHRLEAINTLGAIASGVVGLAKGVAMAGSDRPAYALKLPIVIDLAEIRGQMSGSGTMAARPLRDNPGWTISAAFADSPPGKRGFLPRADRVAVHAAIVVSTCRPLRITLEQREVHINLALTVADPDWLTPVPLPAKGSVSFHPLCGVDIQPGAETTIGTDALAEALFKQVNAIKSAAAP
jgi:hypothetical protein